VVLLAQGSGKVSGIEVKLECEGTSFVNGGRKEGVGVRTARANLKVVKVARYFSYTFLTKCWGLGVGY
jgi:hypothetical protein